MTDKPRNGESWRNTLLYALFTTFIVVVGFLLNHAFSGIDAVNKDLQDFKMQYYQRHEVILKNLEKLQAFREEDQKKIDEILKDIKDISKKIK